MSFYGNILNRIDRAFSKIRVNETDIEATHENDILSLKGENGIELSNEDKEIIIDGNAFITQIVASEETTDNALKYSFRNATDEEIGCINIPLDLILQSAHLDTSKKEIVLVFKTSETNEYSEIRFSVADLYDADEVNNLSDRVDDLSSSVGELNTKVDTLQVAEYNPDDKALEFN